MSHMHKSRRKRRKGEQLTVSLFPFLAVLICTLGVLIVLLVLAVKSADTQAQSRIQASDQQAEEQRALVEKQQAEIEHLEDLLDLQETQIEGIAEVRPEALLRMQSAREHRAHIEDSIRETEQEAQLIADELKRLMNVDSTIASQPVDASDLELLKSKIAEAKAVRDAKRGEADQPMVQKYGIVPYRGQGGTLRRPIFVECTADKLILQPHGIEIAKADFIPPLETGNMLDAALLTIRNYFQKYKLVEDSEKPYPLLVVRPEGAETYGLARRAMKSWDDEFGYELVESNTPIDFGQPDLQLAQEVRIAVDEAKRRQREIAARRAMMQASGQYGTRSGGGQGGDQRPGFRVSGSKGGFVAENGSATRSSSVAHANREAGAERGSESRNEQAGLNSNSSEKNNAAQKASFQSGSDDVSNSASSAATNQGSGGNSAVSSMASPDSLASERGTNWALPTQTPGATGYVRPVRVFCQPDRFVVFNGNNRPANILFQADSTATIDELVHETWELIESWGIAGSNAYWKPDLRVTVMPGAEMQFQRFKSMLDQSGLGIEQVTDE